MTTVREADRACDLECVTGVKGAGARHEFIGPVKIVLLEPTLGQCCRRAWGAAVCTFAMLLMGATVFIVFAFTLRFKLSFAMNLHVFLCTMGLQLFVPSGILMFNSLFGPAAPLSMLDKKLQHFILQLCGVGTVAAGTTMVVLFEKVEYSMHSLAGFAAAGLAALNFLIGPIVCIKSPHTACGHFYRQVHTIIGLPAFIMGAVCFINGLLKESFVKWAVVVVENFHNIVIFLTLIYSMIVIISVSSRSKAVPQ